MDRRKDIMQKKSTSGAGLSSSGTSMSEYNVDIPCFPSPIFSSHSHLRHVLPQIPTRAGHPKMAVSKASTRDPFIGRMFEGESFEDVITTHKLDDGSEQTDAVMKGLCDDSKFCDRIKPESCKPGSSEGTSYTSAEQFVNTLEYTLQENMTDKKPSVWEEDIDRSSPSSMLNICETPKKRSSTNTSPDTSELVKLGQKEPKYFSSVVDDTDSGYLMSLTSSSSKRNKPSSAVDSEPHSESRYLTKSRNRGKSSLFPMFDDDDTDDENGMGSSDSPVAMNLSLPTKSPVRPSANTERLPNFPATHCRAAGRESLGGSPLDAIVKMTSMINTSKSQPPSVTAGANAAADLSSFPQQFSTTCPPYQARGHAWPEDAARIFGGDSLLGTSYGKIAAEGMLKLPVYSQASGAFDCTQARSTSESVNNQPAYKSVSETTDMPWDSSMPSAKPSRWKSGEACGDSAHTRTSNDSPIKLKIRRDSRGDNTQLSVVTSEHLKGTGDTAVKSGEAVTGYHPSQLALSLLGAVPSPGTASAGTTKSKLPAPGRAKTKGELKKQLFERKEQRLRTDGSQASSPAGSSTMTPSPSRSHAEALSPLSVNVDGGSSTPQPSPQLSVGKTNIATVTSPTEQVSILCILVCIAKYTVCASCVVLKSNQ